MDQRLFNRSIIYFPVLQETPQVQELPLNVRDFVDLAKLVPGIYQRPTEDDQGQGVGSAGTRTDSTNFILDGVGNRQHSQWPDFLTAGRRLSGGRNTRGSIRNAHMEACRKLQRRNRRPL